MVVVRATFLIPQINCWNACISHDDRYASLDKKMRSLWLTSQDPKRPLILLGHSLGGILIKQVSDLSYQRLHNAFALMATPTIGSYKCP
jgi:hypothetical protein